MLPAFRRVFPVQQEAHVLSGCLRYISTPTANPKRGSDSEPSNKGAGSIEPHNETTRASLFRPHDGRVQRSSDHRSFSSFLTDNYSREHNYLRISVTERCNLRCIYCMPEEGVRLTPDTQTLTTAEIVYLARLFVKQGVDKIRLTGGEPTVRKDFVSLVRQLGQLRTLGLKELCLTTNGISLYRKLDDLVAAGVTGINLSLDTLDPFQFTLMTRRNGHEAVMRSMNQILAVNQSGRLPSSSN